MTSTVRLRLFLLVFIVAVCSLVYFVSRYSHLNNSERFAIVTAADGRDEAEVLDDIEEQLDERNQGSLIGIVGSLAAGLLSVWGVVDTFWREIGGSRKLQMVYQELQNEKLKLEIEKLKSELKAIHPPSESTDT